MIGVNDLGHHEAMQFEQLRQSLPHVIAIFDEENFSAAAPRGSRWHLMGWDDIDARHTA
jgi:hypothetical protein